MNRNSKSRVIIPIITAVVALIIGAVAGYQYKEYEISKKLDEVFSTNKSENKETSGNNSDNKKTDIDDNKLSKIMDATKSKFASVSETKVFNEENDPNGTLGKPGSYTNGAAFKDSRTEYTTEDAMWGTDAGGAIEVFASEEDATNRASTLKGTQGTFLDSGAVEQVGNVILRASSKLPASQQNEIIAFLKSQL